MNESLRRIVVVGGGIGGLAAAYRIRKEVTSRDLSVRITLLEGSARLGGMIRTVESNGWVMEDGADSFLAEKETVTELSDELALSDEMISTQTAYRKTFVLSGGKLKPVPPGFYLMGPAKLTPFLRSNLLTLRGRIRALWEIMIPRGQHIGDESVGSFVSRRFGPELLHAIAGPMISGIYAADPYHLSLASTFPRFLQMEKESGSVIRGLRKESLSREKPITQGARYSLFVSYRKGMETLVSALHRQLTNIDIQLNSRVLSLSLLPNSRWKVAMANEVAIEADAVILALPGRASAEILAPLLNQTGTFFKEMSYGSTGVINLAYSDKDISHPLNGMGFVVPEKENRMFFACSFLSRKFENRSPSGHSLLRAFVGGPNGKKYLDWGDEELVQSVHKELAIILGIRERPLHYRVSRFQTGLPHYRPGHSEAVRGIERDLETLPGLYLVSNALRGIGLPDVIEMAETAARKVVDNLST